MYPAGELTAAFGAIPVPPMSLIVRAWKPLVECHVVQLIVTSQFGSSIRSQLMPGRVSKKSMMKAEKSAPVRA